MSSERKLTRRGFGQLGVAMLTGLVVTPRELRAEVPAPAEAPSRVRLQVDVTRVDNGVHLRLTVVNTGTTPLQYDHPRAVPSVMRVDPDGTSTPVSSTPVDGFDMMYMLVRAIPTEFRPLPPGVPVYVSTWHVGVAEGELLVELALSLDDRMDLEFLQARLVLS